MRFVRFRGFEGVVRGGRFVLCLGLGVGIFGGVGRSAEGVLIVVSFVLFAGSLRVRDYIYVFRVGVVYIRGYYVFFFSGLWVAWCL